MDEEYEDEGSELDQLIESQEEQLAMAEEQQRLQIQEKLLRNKLRAIFRNHSLGRTVLNQNEKKTMKEAKQFPSLKQEIYRINSLLAMNKAKRFSRLMSSSPIFMFIFYGALFAFFIIAVVAFVGSLFSWLFPSDDGSVGTANSILGINGADFYGARMVYTDQEKARSSIVKDYVQFVENGIIELEKIETVDEYSVTLNLTNLVLPDETYNYSTFEETDFKIKYSNLHEIIFDIAKEVYFIDNGESYDESSLTECIDGIKYFGFANLETVAPMVAEEIVVVSSASKGGENVSDSSTLSSIEQKIESDLIDFYKSNTSYELRTEKLFVKDYILEEADATISGVTKENYVAMIFMPRKNVVFTGFSFAVGNSDLTNFSINIDGVLMGTDGRNLGNEENQSYLFGSIGIVNVSADKFTDIDEQNKKALSEGMSLFDIVENSELNNDYYLTDSNGVLTLKRNGVVVELFNDNPFLFVEFDTSWQTAS